MQPQLAYASGGYGKHIPLIKSVAVRVLSQTVGVLRIEPITTWGGKGSNLPC